MNIAGPETEHEIAGINHVPEVAMNAVEPRLIAHPAMSVLRNLIGDRLAADAGDRRFTRSVDIRHDHVIGVIESAAKFLAQRFGARETMRLEHRQDAVSARRFGGGESGANFRRMMRVIVHQQKSIARILDLESAPRVLEFAQRSGNFLEGNPELGGQRDHPESVLHIMLARHVQHGFTELFAAPEHTKNRSDIAQLDVCAAVICFFRKTVRDRSLRAIHKDGLCSHHPR